MSKSDTIKELMDIGAESMNKDAFLIGRAAIVIGMARCGSCDKVSVSYSMSALMNAFMQLGKAVDLDVKSLKEVVDEGFKIYADMDAAPLGGPIN